MRIAPLGLGSMDGLMARDPLAAGHAPTVWHRPPGKAAPLTEMGARAAGGEADTFAAAAPAFRARGRACGAVTGTGDARRPPLLPPDRETRT